MALHHQLPCHQPGRASRGCVCDWTGDRFFCLRQPNHHSTAGDAARSCNGLGSDPVNPGEGQRVGVGDGSGGASLGWADGQIARGEGLYLYSYLAQATRGTRNGCTPYTSGRGTDSCSSRQQNPIHSKRQRCMSLCGWWSRQTMPVPACTISLDPQIASQEPPMLLQPRISNLCPSMLLAGLHQPCAPGGRLSKPLRPGSMLPGAIHSQPRPAQRV